MLDYIIVFTLQFAYVVFKFMNTRAIVLGTHNRIKTIIISTVATTLYYFSTVIGVSGFIKGDYKIAIFFIVATVLAVLVEKEIDIKFKKEIK